MKVYLTVILIIWTQYKDDDNIITSNFYCEVKCTIMSHHNGFAKQGY